MSNGFLSQEEIDSLLNGGGETQTEETKQLEPVSSAPQQEEVLSDIEKDLLGEIGNISMGSASTALSTIIGQQVNITTPIVTLTTLRELRANFEVPNMALDVEYTSGINGQNVLIMKITDAGVIASLMMGGDRKVQVDTLTEIEISAVSEAMNQMIGSAATSMATMFAREVNISPPNSRIWSEDTEEPLNEKIDEDETIVEVSFSLKIGELVDSTLMQVLPIDTAKKIVSIMMGEEVPDEGQPAVQEAPKASPEPSKAATKAEPNYSPNPPIVEKPIEAPAPRVEVQKASFRPLQEVAVNSAPKNIDLILDVPLDISVVLGRTKKSIKEILSFGTGSLIELDKLAEEPVEILVNGKRVAYGEVVVVDENFGVRISSIISSAERVKTLGK